MFKIELCKNLLYIVINELQITITKWYRPDNVMTLCHLYNYFTIHVYLSTVTLLPYLLLSSILNNADHQSVADRVA